MSVSFDDKNFSVDDFLHIAQVQIFKELCSLFFISTQLFLDFRDSNLIVFGFTQIFKKLVSIIN